MEASNDIMIRISPNEGKITVEEDAQGVFSRKSITEEDLLRCFKGQQTRAITAVSCR